MEKSIEFWTYTTFYNPAKKAENLNRGKINREIESDLRPAQ